MICSGEFTYSHEVGFFWVLIVCCCWATGITAEPTTYRFGKDAIMVDAKAFEKTRTLVRNQRPKGTMKLVPKGIKVRESRPLFRVPKNDIAMEVEEKLVIITYASIGQYIEAIQNPKHIVALMAILHKDYKKSRLDSKGFANVVASAKKKIDALPFVLINSKIEKETIGQGIFKKGNEWFVHFLLVEGSSVFEYKYVICPGNKIGRLRRALIQGPKNPAGNNVGRPPTEWPAEKQHLMKVFRRCRDYLISQTMFHK
jgi:hypothetical protein